MIEWLEPGVPFPEVTAALEFPNGLLAASGHLDADLLLQAYPRGIFPWYGDGDPVLWWSPDPRMVLPTAEIRVSRSLRKTLRDLVDDEQRTIRLDADFPGVMRACAAPRQGQDGTWIDERIRAAYGELARRGLAHSIELWDDGELVGGAYGVALGRMFYGESMFSAQRDASKIALAALVALLRREGVPVIDCQQRTDHLASLGAREIPRRAFCAHVAEAVAREAVPWARYRGVRLNGLLDDLLVAVGPDADRAAAHWDARSHRKEPDSAA